MNNESLKLRNQICFRLYTASRLITQAYEPYFKPLGITYTQYLVLLVLWETDHQPIGVFVERLKLGINSVSPLLKRMENLGLIERKENENDKRSQIISLTKKGFAMKSQAAKIPGCLEDCFKDQGVDLEELASLAPVLDKLISKLSPQK